MSTPCDEQVFCITNFHDFCVLQQFSKKRNFLLLECSFKIFSAIKHSCTRLTVFFCHFQHATDDEEIFTTIMAQRKFDNFKKKCCPFLFNFQCIEELAEKIYDLFCAFFY